MNNDMKKPSVSIGIVAHNEERNIQNVLRDILRQKQHSWSLRHIYVACDACTDATVLRIQEVADEHIRIINNEKRQGKAANEQKIFDRFRDDILVMFDADVRLFGDSVVETLIHPIITQKNVLLTGGNPQPYPPKTFIERAVYTTFEVLDASREHLRDGNNIYGASGQCLALKKSLVQRIHFPEKIIAEDDYIYFTCRTLAGEFRHVRKAVVHYKLPNSLADFFMQSLRSDTTPAIRNVEEYFIPNMVRSAYERPFSFYARKIGAIFMKYPIETVFIIFFKGVSRVFSLFVGKRQSPHWQGARTTK